MGMWLTATRMELLLTLHLMEFELQLWLTRERLGLTEVPILSSFRSALSGPKSWMDGRKDRAKHS